VSDRRIKGDECAFAGRFACPTRNRGTNATLASKAR